MGLKIRLFRGQEYEVFCAPTKYAMLITNEGASEKGDVSREKGTVMGRSIAKYTDSCLSAAEIGCKQLLTCQIYAAPFAALNDPAAPTPK